MQKANSNILTLSNCLADCLAFEFGSPKRSARRFKASAFFIKIYKLTLIIHYLTSNKFCHITVD